MLKFQQMEDDSERYILNNPRLYEEYLVGEYGYYELDWNNRAYDASMFLENKKGYKIFSFNLFLEKLWQDKPNREEDEEI